MVYSIWRTAIPGTSLFVKQRSPANSRLLWSFFCKLLCSACLACLQRVSSRVCWLFSTWEGSRSYYYCARKAPSSQLSSFWSRWPYCKVLCVPSSVPVVLPLSGSSGKRVTGPCCLLSSLCLWVFLGATSCQLAHSYFISVDDLGISASYLPTLSCSANTQKSHHKQRCHSQFSASKARFSHDCSWTLRDLSEICQVALQSPVLQRERHKQLLTGQSSRHSSPGDPE